MMKDRTPFKHLVTLNDKTKTKKIIYGHEIRVFVNKYKTINRA